jgi:hypothetical protein
MGNNGSCPLLGTAHTVWRVGERRPWVGMRCWLCLPMAPPAACSEPRGSLHTAMPCMLF